MLFHNLDEDIIPQILVFCDVQSVLRIGQTNRLMHALASRKDIWLAVIQDLSCRGLIDFLPPEMLRKATVTDLLAEVKRAVMGPKTWSPTSSVPPTIARQRSVPLNESSRRFGAFKILPGGEYVALKDNSGLEIWAITPPKRIWTWHSTSERFQYAVELRDGGKTASLLICSSEPALQLEHVEIIEVDLTTGDWCLVFPHGKFFVLTLSLFDSEQVAFLLVNWSTEEYVAFKFRVVSASLFRDISRLVLLPKHVVVTYTSPSPPTNMVLAVYSMDSFSSSWLPIPVDCSLENLVYSTNIRPTALTHLPFKGHIHSRLMAQQSALCRDTYLLKLHVQWSAQEPVAAPSPSLSKRLFSRSRRATPPGDQSHRGEIPGTIFTFSLSNASTSQFALRTVSVVPSLCTRRFWWLLSFSGYGVTFSGLDDHPTVMDALQERDGVERERENFVTLAAAQYPSSIADLSPSSTAVVVIKGNELLILYYQ
ncbi:hypothetical protein MVEN_01426800 [Mycena venus]|uniref:F-box domain-containing protein n=1 Tax=Mycena venus TaxID=2733690 RepID=A0A8H6XYS8_9AGAR|nr:hypothetical protein MVEN_01426800 [Mycena venus]